MSETKELKPFTITRAVWLRGDQFGEGSYLYRPIDGKMCCLGQFLARIHGVSINVMSKQTSPICVIDALSDRAKAELIDPDFAGQARNGVVTVALMGSNDGALSESRREQAIAHGFAELGYAVTFED